jgi:hypothetical protein
VRADLCDPTVRDRGSNDAIDVALQEIGLEVVPES